MIRSHPQRFQVCISAGRPQNVQAVRDAFGPTTFVVPEEQLDDYSKAGAISVSPFGYARNCAVARTNAMKLAFDAMLPVLMLDDDPTGKMEYIHKKVCDKPIKMSINFEEVLRELAAALDAYPDARLYALTHMTNAFWVGERRYSTASAINGGCMFIKPNPLTFDPTLPLNSDVDYGLQHLDRYGQAIRINNVFVHFGRGNKDGAGVGAYRNDELRAATVKRLKQKWPDWVSTRPGKPEHPIVSVRRKRVRFDR